MIFRFLSALFVISLLMPSKATYAHDYPLSPESKEFIAIAAAIGGGICGGIGLAVALDEVSQQKPNPNATFWDKIKAFPWAKVLVPAAIGAAITGGCSYFFTSEKYLSSAQDTIDALESDRLFRAALKDDASMYDMKKWSFASRWPTIATYQKLDDLYFQLCRAKSYLLTVIKSGISPLASIASETIKKLEDYETRIIENLRRIKCNSSYLYEIVERNKAIAFEQMIQQQRRIADAAWYQLHKPRPITPPVVIIRH